MDIAIKKIPGGISIDDLELRSGKCGCTTVLPCCYSWSKVRQGERTVQFTAKATGPETKRAFTWGYIIQKCGVTVEVSFEDDPDKKIFSGYYPPRIEEFTAKSWEVVSRTGEREDFGVWRCAACRWLYKEKSQLKQFEDLPGEWKCPVCKAGKASFEQVA
jgi:rubredoxin